MEQGIKVRENGPILELTLDRPGKRNAINDKMLVDLKRHAAHFIDEPAFRVLLLRAEGAFFLPVATSTAFSCRTHPIEAPWLSGSGSVMAGQVFPHLSN
jgi:enoyl-CoA hydratase/carnithine racemase